jgi:hypothetical protein
MARKTNVMVLGALLLTLLVPGAARADLLVWDLLASCPAGKQEVKLKMTYSLAGYWQTDPLKASQTLYGCGGGCQPGLLSSSVSWQAAKTSCWCLPSGTEVQSEDACGPNEYAKCSAVVEATLPYSCDQLAYTKICNRAVCEAKDDMMYGPDGVCAAIKPSTAADQCLATPAMVVRAGELGPNVEAVDQPTSTPTDQELEEMGGCSISVGTANASLLGLLLLVAGLSLLISRRRRR